MKITLLALAEHATADGARCYPSIGTLAVMTGQCEKTCREWLKKADGQWFSRSAVKLKGREWRGYNYALQIPEGAVTDTGPRRQVAVSDTAPDDTRCGNSGNEVRYLTPRGAVGDTDELGRATRKSNKGEKHAADAAPRAGRKLTLRQWLDTFPADAETVLDGHPVLDYLDDIGLPEDFGVLAWEQFIRRYTNGADALKTSADWPGLFYRSVQENWAGLWRINSDGGYVLTTSGQQAMRAMDAEDRRR